MELREPKSMSELVYFTNRDEGKYKVRAWVFKGICPKCKKGLMSKPINEKTGRPKTRATIYVCSECGYTVDKEEYEETLMCNIEYTCPECGFHGKTQTPFKRVSFKGVKSIVFRCEKCNVKLPITKKMKEIKKKNK